MLIQYFGMAYIFNLSSISLNFLILLIISFTLFVQLAPVISADMKMRKLGHLLSSPPSPKLNPSDHVHH
ncbi:hypothetical protein MtrunA17_Chr6g0483501 [Medicago truncatula]|uniref:Transmembrane protein n=1 Tax=Medicago truncatula TaxID=3880 RepID=A0A396HHI1_MEDTR|nr:hypothetical protein MtrunA17_Chr6g0483501 [Medicago truncatula]